MSHEVSASPHYLVETFLVELPKRVHHGHRGFTLVELMVVVGLIALMMVVLLPAIEAARDDARKAQCQNNLKQIGLALEKYHATHSVFPYATSCSFPVETRFTNSKHVWTEFLLPYLNEGDLYQKINFSESLDVGENRRLLEGRKMPMFACPSNPWTDTFETRDGQFFREIGTNDFGTGDGPQQGLDYPLCAGSILPDLLPPDCKDGENSFCVSEAQRPNQFLRWWQPQKGDNPAVFNRGVTSTSLKDVTDGASQTIAAGERNAEECCLAGVFSWNAPIFFTGQRINSETRSDNPNQWWMNCGSSSHHEGGGYFLFVDGSVRFLKNAIDHRVYCHLGDKADGHDEKLPND